LLIEKQKQLDKLSKKEIKRQSLPQEPDEKNANSALIALRFPHDGNILKRRFFKSDKIQVILKIINK